MTGHIYLVGFMGSGKSTVGRALARRLGLPFVDLDREIERREGRTISEIFEQSGEETFRSLETQALLELPEDERMVVALGGGAVLREENRERIRTGTCFYIRPSREVLVKRLALSKHRPLLETADRDERIAALLEQREDLYQEVADSIVHVEEGEEPAEVAETIAGEVEKLGG